MAIGSENGMRWLRFAGCLLLAGALSGCDAWECLTLEYKIGQMLLVGFRGTEITAGSPIAADIQERHIGGVILFEYDAPSQSRPRNITSPQQLRALTEALQQASPDTLLIAIDQEGGYVNRLKESYGFPPTVSAQYLGDTNDPCVTQLWAANTATNLFLMGINANFAPVVDLNVNPDCPVIGRIERSFSADPAVVAEHAGIFVEEHQRLHVRTVLKHFPGHGSSATDSHLGMTDVTETWSEIELQPYVDMLAAGRCDAVMTAHVFNRNLDPDWPATLSEEIIGGVLRGQIGFDGLVISDDMQMGAIVENYSFETAIERAINAGVDMLILSNNGSVFNENIAAEAIAVIKDAVQAGRIPLQRIHEAYCRIQCYKQGLSL